MGNIDENKRIVRRMIKLIDAKDEAFFDHFTEDAIFQGWSDIRRPLSGLRENYLKDLNSFPDYKYNINRMIAEGDSVVVHYTWTGTQKGEYLGVPASGNKVSVPFVDTFDIEDGKIKLWRCMANWAYFKSQMTR